MIVLWRRSSPAAETVVQYSLSHINDSSLSAVAALAVSRVAPRVQALLGGMPGLARIQLSLSHAEMPGLKSQYQWHGPRVSGVLA
jgi:hypothetical protein